MQNLKKYAINFFFRVKNLNRLDDNIWHNRNEIKVECIWFCKISKYMDRLVIKLKTIKYKKDFFYYLSFYLDLGLQAACF